MLGAEILKYQPDICGVTGPSHSKMSVHDIQILIFTFLLIFCSSFSKHLRWMMGIWSAGFLTQWKVLHSVFFGKRSRDSAAFFDQMNPHAKEKGTGQECKAQKKLQNTKVPIEKRIWERQKSGLGIKETGTYVDRGNREALTISLEGSREQDRV